MNQIAVNFIHKNKAGEAIAVDRFTLANEDLDQLFREWIADFCIVEIGDTFAIEESI
jgi:hypothetical protein